MTPGEIPPPFSGLPRILWLIENAPQELKDDNAMHGDEWMRGEIEKSFMPDTFDSGILPANEFREANGAA